MRLNLSSPPQVKDAFNEIVGAICSHNPHARIQGVTIGEMVPGDREVFVGMNRDPQFGPVLLFGLGGIFIETLEEIKSLDINPIILSGLRAVAVDARIELTG